MKNAIHRPNVIDRPRLLEKLAHVVDHKVTLISAPPGYGKTTLAAQFAHHSPYPVAWHAIEERERDVPNLHQQSLAALAQVVSGIRALGLSAVLSPSELAAQITNYLRDTSTSDIIYILDDVQHLGGSLAAERWLSAFVTLVPPNCHLVLVGRTLPDLPLAHLIARGELLTVSQDDLRLTQEEVDLLASQVAGTDTNRRRFRDLEQRLEGWPAGIVLIYYPLPDEVEQVILKGQGGPEALFNVLATPMLKSQPPEIRDFLLVSSTLSRMTSDLCDRALGLANSAELLDAVQARNLFASRTASGLVYHTLFRAFLQGHLKATAHHTFIRLHGRAAVYFETTDESDEAIKHYLDAELPDAAAAVADRAATAYFIEGKVETLLTWATRLAQTAEQAPNLLYRCAIVHGDRYEYVEAERKLSTAEAVYNERMSTLDLINIALQRATIALQQGQYQLAMNRAKQLLQEETESVIVRLRALNVLGFASLYLGDTQAAVNYLEEARPLYDAHMDAYARSQLLQTLGTAYSRLGQLAQAAACLQEVVALRRGLGARRALAGALNNLGYFYHRESDYQQALSTFEEGLAILAQLPEMRAEAYLLWSLGDLKRDLGSFDEALKCYYTALERLGDGEPSLRCSILTSLSILRRWEGQGEDSVAHGAQAAELANTHGMLLEHSAAQAALWTARAYLGEADQAAHQLEGILTDLRQRKAQYELIRTLGFCAFVSLQRSALPEARHYLQSAIGLAEDVGSAQPLSAEIVHSPSLRALVPATEPNVLIRDLKRLDAARLMIAPRAKSAPRNTRRLPYSLRIMTLGQETILRDGEIVPASAWRASTAREMFFYLLFVGPETREQLCLLFWPESTTQRVRSNFHTTLYHARVALGADTLTFQDGRYRLNRDVAVWCDAQAVEQLCVQARQQPPRDARTEDRYRKAVALYQGDFLPSLDAEWAIAYRERLRDLYLEALIGLGECTRSRQELGEALDCFKRALTIDPYREDIHRIVLACYAEHGEKQKVRTHLHDLRTLFRKDLATQLSEETLELASRLLS